MIDDILDKLKKIEEKIESLEDESSIKENMRVWKKEFDQLYKYDSEALLYRAGEWMRTNGQKYSL